MLKDSDPDALALWRKQLLARLAAERVYLLQQYWGLPADMICRYPMNEQGWTAKDLLAHIGFWDTFYTRWMSMVLDGRQDEIELSDEGKAALSEENQQRFQGLSLEESLAICLKERRGFLVLLGQVPDGLLHRRIRFSSGWQTSMRTWARGRFLHDARHAAELKEWRTDFSENNQHNQLFQSGPKRILQALVRATGQEWQTVVALVPAEERGSRPIVNGADLLELTRRLTGWAKFGAGTLARLAQGPLAFPVTTATYESFDRALSAANQGQSWDEVWSQWEQAQKGLLAQIESASEPALGIAFVTPWGTATNGYRFATFCGLRPSAYAADLRQALTLPNLPRRLKQHPKI